MQQGAAVRRVLDLHRRDGLPGVAFRAAQLAAQGVGCEFELYDLYVNRGNGEPPDAPARGWSWGWLGEGGPGGPRLDDLAALRPDASLYRERLAKGYRCAVAWDAASGGVIAMAWYRRDGHHDEGGARLPIAAGDLWAEDGVVREDWRGRGVHPTLSRLVLGQLREAEDVRRALLSIDVTNRRSRRAAAKRGATRVRRVMTLRLGPCVVARDGRRWKLGRAPLGLAPVEPSR